MKKLFNILGNLHKESVNNIFLSINDKVDVEGLKELKIDSIPNNTEYLLTGRHYLNIPKGKEFDVIFSMKHPENYINFNTKIIEIRIGRGEEVNVLPEDISGECLIEFTNGKPELLSKLSIWGEEFNKDKNEFLYLTTQPVMDRILELLNE